MRAVPTVAGALLTILGVLAGSAGLAAAQERIVVHPELGTPVVATRLLIAAGPADEDPAMAGIAHLAARSVVRPIRAALDSLDAHLAVTPEKDAVAISLIAAPDAWPEASRLLLVALFRDQPDSASIAAEKRAIEEELIGRRNNPADAAIRAADASFFGEDHPWGRATVGEPATLRRLTTADVRQFLEDHFTPSRAFAAVVGPVETGAVRDHLLRHLEESGPVPSPLVARRRSEPSPSRTEYSSVTTWVTVAYPFSAAADIEALRMLARLAGEELGFGPTRRSVYDMKATVTPRTSGGEVRFTLVVPPEEADAWAERVREIVDGLPDQPRVSEGWEGLLRRYRGQRLSELASPEARAAAAVQALFTSGDTSSPIPEFEDLTLARVREAAAALAEPIVVFLGPFQDEGG